jgi:hypothetical protein
MTTQNAVYQPGDIVPASGLYDVFHDRLDGHEHALPHQVTAVQGTRFPPCRACHDHVRFRLNQEAVPVETHDLFRLSGIPGADSGGHP